MIRLHKIFRPFALRNLDFNLVQIFNRKYGSIFDDFVHGFQLANNHKKKAQIEKLLCSNAVQIDFSDYFDTGVVTDNCPVKKVYVNQLAANSPIEDRWNIGLTQVDGVVSSLMFTVLDGHSGPACVHAVAWSILDYVAAAHLDSDKLGTALHNWVAQDELQPYHLSRRLRLVNPYTKQLLGHVATPPPAKIAAFLRRRLQNYIQELITRTDRSMEPSDCLTEAILRLDFDLCSMGHNSEVIANKRLRPAEFLRTPANDLALSHDLLHVALSGAVAIVGRLFWHNIADQSGNMNAKKHPVELHLANVGDCGAILLHETNSSQGQSSSSLIPTICTRPHCGAANEKEIARVSEEHPENSTDELFREGGRLLGELAPCRSFGDVRYKWPADRLLEVSRYLSSDNPTNSSPSLRETRDSAFMPIPHPYSSPPYLTACPEVMRFELSPSARYLILATDGLWDMVSPAEAAQVVAKARWANQCPATRLLWRCLSGMPPSMAKAIRGRGSVAREFRKGSSTSDRDPDEEDENDENAAIRRASALLSLPPGVARFYRDDITIFVLELRNQEEKPLR